MINNKIYVLFWLLSKNIKFNKKKRKLPRLFFSFDLRNYANSKVFYMAIFYFEHFFVALNFIYVSTRFFKTLDDFLSGVLASFK